MSGVALMAECACRKDDESGPLALAPARDDVLGHLPHERDLGMQAGANGAVDGLHIGSDTGANGVDGHGFAAGARAANRTDDSNFALPPRLKPARPTLRRFRS